MTFIRMVRHGETDYNVEQRTQGWTDIPLNERGKNQAALSLPLILENNWDMMVSSPLQRAKQTATIFQSKLSIPLLIMEAFKERHYGDVEGMLRAERKRRFPHNIYPNSENREDVIERVMNGFGELHRLYENKNILIITHGGAINAALTVCSGGMYGYDRTKISNLSFTDFHFNKGKWDIICINE